MKPEIKHKFERIYGDEADSIFRFCLTRVSNRDQALDITQETFLRLWKSLLDQKDILNERAFLFTVAHRLVIDWYRKKKSVSLESMMYKDIEVEYNPVDEKTVNISDLGAEGRHLLERINELAPTFRDPLYLYFVEDLSPIEIGNIMGISANATSVRINRGLVELRKKTGYDNAKNK